METTGQNEQGAGRIAAALSAALKGLSEVQESQKRIEDQQKKSGEALAQYSERLVKIESGLGRGLNAVGGRIESVQMAAEALGMSIEKFRNEKKPVRWKHHLRAGGIVLGALGFGLLVGWFWALVWLRIDETKRMTLDAERDVGHAVMLKVEHADVVQRDLIALLISSDDMSKDQRQKVREWLEARSGKATVGNSGK